MGPMLDTHTVARSLTDAEFTPAAADAIRNALRLAAEPTTSTRAPSPGMGIGRIALRAVQGHGGGGGR